jgi:uncharacterized integral membrane protein
MTIRYGWQYAELYYVACFGFENVKCKSNSENFKFFFSFFSLIFFVFLSFSATKIFFVFQGQRFSLPLFVKVKTN